MLAGVLAYVYLPVASLPQTEFPTIAVQASLPGASPAVMASSIATPLERQFSRIAGVNEMTSASAIGTTSVTLQFDLGRNLNGAARDVQAAINAARSQLPSDLPAAPSWHKVNPTEPSILILVVDSEQVPVRELYDLADSVLAQKIAQVRGVGQVSLNGATKPAVRIEVNPFAVNAYGIGFAQLRAAITAASLNRPKGQLVDEVRQWTIFMHDQLTHAAEYAPLIVAMHKGVPVRLRDVATVTDSVEDLRTSGWINGQHGIQIIVSKASGENTIATVDRVLALLPQLRQSVPPTVRLYSMMDRTTTIRASIKDISWMLLLSILLVVVVVFVFLREVRSTLIPSVSVPLSLLGTFAAMHLLGYTLDNLSLMAITVATGFVVDDAIVVIENVDRHLRAGLTPREAALRGSGEVGSTLLAMSVSLVSAFLPMLLMSGIVGRLFREFSVVLSIATGISLLVSLSVTPMLCATFLEPHAVRRYGRVRRFAERLEEWMEGVYASGVLRVLRHQWLMLLVTLGTCIFTGYLYVVIPKGFFPQQDTGRISGQIRGAQSISFEQLSAKAREVQDIVRQDPSVAACSSFFGSGSIGSAPNVASLFIVLKSYEERGGLASAAVMKRLQPRLADVVGVTTTMQQQQELNIGAQSSAAQFQYTISSDSLEVLNQWAPRMTARLQKVPVLHDVISDQLTSGLTAQLTLDRDTAKRLGLNAKDLDDALDDAFGQRQVSTYDGNANQYHVVMEAAPSFGGGPAALNELYVRTPGGKAIPLSSFSGFEVRKSPLVVNHRSQIPSVTISFNLAPGVSLSDAAEAIESAAQQMGTPEAVHTGFAGTAQVFQASLKSQPGLIAMSVVTIYLILGALYENLRYPLVVLATLPAAGMGALLALYVTHHDFSVVAMIGVVLLVGIVQKNAIMLIDFASQAEQREGLTSVEAIYKACRLRFKPIVMTSLTALFGALPLALGGGVGFELREPLGIAIVGGLALSLLLTLYSCPVLYLFFSPRRAVLR